MQEYHNGDQVIGIYIAFFRNQRQGAEAVTSLNVLADEKSQEWSITGETRRNLHDEKEPASVRQIHLRRGNLHMLAWQWYWIDNAQTANAYWAKWFQAKQRLMGRGNDGVDIVIFAPYDAQPNEVVATMENFLAQASPAIRQSLEQMSGNK
jgi:EpsI family protein